MQPVGSQSDFRPGPRPGPPLGAILRRLYKHETADRRHARLRPNPSLRTQVLPIPENRSVLRPRSLHRINVEAGRLADPRDLLLVQRDRTILLPHNTSPTVRRRVIPIAPRLAEDSS